MKKWLTVALCMLALVSTAALAGPDSFGLGSGRDGALTVSTSNLVINSYAQVTAPLARGATSIPVGACAGASDCFKAGDLVMVLQATGLTPGPGSGAPEPIDLGSSPVGRWELARLASVSGMTLSLTTPLVNAYAADVTQVIRVPEYTDVTVNLGRSIGAAPWNGSTGGVIAFLATGTVNNSGDIDASGAGFRGGQYVNDPNVTPGCSGLDEPAPQGGRKGEGIVAMRYGPTHTGRGNVANGAGGGVCFKSGGGGGGNAGAGGMGGRSAGTADGARAVGGLGGAELSYSLLDRLTFGGGGGAGQGSGGTGVLGGSGGGAIFIRANLLAGPGSIVATGSSGGTSTSDGASGGGAGGSIYLRFAGTASCGSVTANGGVGGTVNSTRVGPGGGGGGGRVLFQSAGGSCPVSVIGATAGVQQDPSAPGSTFYGAESGHNGGSTTVPGGFTVPPVPTVITPAHGSITSERRPEIRGKAQPNTTVVIYLDGVEIGRTRSDSNGNYALTPPMDLEDRSYTVDAATELEGVQSPRSPSNTFTVETLDTTLVSTPPATTVSRDATFEFTSPEAGVTFECSLDGAEFTPCPSPVTFTNLPDGEHTLQVRGRDPAGNVDPTPAVYTWTVGRGGVAFLGDGLGCSASGGEASWVLMGLGALATLRRRRRRGG
jgi:uncharacterized protein (TIGR03382 family)